MAKRNIKVIQRVSRRAKFKRSNRVPRNNAYSECARKFASCVLDPLSGSPAKVPDGACHSVLIEYDMSFTGIPLSDGTLVAACWPGLPGAAVACHGTFTGPDRTGAVVTASTSPGQSILYQFPDYANPAPYTSGVSIFYNDGPGPNIRRARVVSYKLEVTPIGTVLNQGGAAATARVPARVQPGFYVLHDNGTGYSGVAYAGASNHPYQIGFSPNSISFSALTSYPDAKVISATESTVLMGMPPHYNYSDSYVFNIDTGNATTDTFPIVGGYVTSGTATAAFGGSYSVIASTGGTTAMLPAASGTDIGLLGNFWQSDCDALFWAGSGLPLTQPYEFRVKVCMELCVSHVNSVYRPFVTPPAPADPGIISKVRSVMAEMPSSMPRTDTSGSWWHSLTLAARGVGELVSGLGIPVVSGAAGVISKLLGKLAV